MKTLKDNDLLWGRGDLPKTLTQKIVVVGKNLVPEKIIIKTFEWVKGEGIIYNMNFENREPIKIEEFTPEEYYKNTNPFQDTKYNSELHISEQYLELLKNHLQNQ